MFRYKKLLFLFTGKATKNVSRLSYSVFTCFCKFLPENELVCLEHALQFFFLSERSEEIRWRCD